MTVPSPSSSTSTSPSTSATSTPWSLPIALSKPRLDPGTGLLVLDKGVFTTQQASYPLKLLSPHARGVRLAYMIAYGGGLVAGDHIHLDIRVVNGVLVLLTQGSTKVFRHHGLRPRSHLLHGSGEERGAPLRNVYDPPRPRLEGTKDSAVDRAAGEGKSEGAGDEDREGEGEGDGGKVGMAEGEGEKEGEREGGKEGEEPPTSRQRMRVTVGPGATLLLLPDSISPFASSRYVQAQRFVLAPGASCLVLDWVNSGRGKHAPPSVLPHNILAPPPPPPISTSRSSSSPSAPSDDTSTEFWEMSYYASINEIVTPSGTVLARERMVLQDQPGNTIRDRLKPYHVYATLMAYGPTMRDLQDLLDRVADNESQFQIPRPPGLIWSWSRTDHLGGIVRLAAVHVEDIRVWVRSVLRMGGMEGLVGAGLWPRCI